MSLFTIEQVELIRRLRKSGVTRWQVIEAYDQLERMEMECQPSASSSAPAPHSVAPPPASPLLLPPSSPASTAASQPTLLAQRAAAAAAAAAAAGAAAASAIGHGSSSNSMSERHAPSPLPAMSSANQPSPGQRVTAAQQGRAVSTGPPPLPPLPSPLLSPSAIGSPQTPGGMLAASQAALLAHAAHMQQQQQHALTSPGGPLSHLTMSSTGIGVSSPSQRTASVVRGSGGSSSGGGGSTRYLLSPLDRRDSIGYGQQPPAGLSLTLQHIKPDLHASSLTHDDNVRQELEGHATKEEMSPMDDGSSEAGGSRLSSQPWHHVKSRFIFRKGHLAILEEQFKKNQYPDAEQRRDIAETCNRAYPSSSSRVTPIIVLNWFSNKRKAVRNHLKGRVITGSSRELVERVLQDISPSAAHYLFQGAPNTSGGGTNSSSILNIGGSGSSHVGGGHLGGMAHVSQSEADTAHAFTPFGHHHSVVAVGATSAAAASMPSASGSASDQQRLPESPGGASYDSDSGSSSGAGHPTAVVCKTEAA